MALSTSDRPHSAITGRYGSDLITISVGGLCGAIQTTTLVVSARPVTVRRTSSTGPAASLIARLILGLKRRDHSAAIDRLQVQSTRALDGSRLLANALGLDFFHGLGCDCCSCEHS